MDLQSSSGWVCDTCGRAVPIGEAHACRGIRTEPLTPSEARLLGLKTESVLEEAQRLVHGNRQADYGHPIVDYKATGRIWGALIERWLVSLGFPLPPEGFPDVDPRICTLMMAGVKLSREAGKHKRDNNVDTAGYAECTEMIAEKQAE